MSLSPSVQGFSGADGEGHTAQNLLVVPPSFGQAMYSRQAVARTRSLLAVLVVSCQGTTSAPVTKEVAQAPAEVQPAPAKPPQPKPQPKPQPEPPGAKPPPKADADPPPTPPGPPPIFDQQVADAARLAEHLCNHGGDWFAPPSGKPYPKWDDWDYQPGDPLSSCDEVHAETVKTFASEHAAATITRLEVVVENADGDGPGLIAVQEVATIRTEAGVTDHTITAFPVSDFEEASDQSTALSFDRAEFRDLLGGPSPDLLVSRRSSTDGNFEADRCYNETEETTSVVICGDHPTRPGCIDIPVDLKVTTQPWSDLSECDDEDIQTRRQIAGYVVTYAIPKKDVFKAKLTRKRTRKARFGQTPPVTDTTSLDALFQADDLDVDLRGWSSPE